MAGLSPINLIDQRGVLLPLVSVRDSEARCSVAGSAECYRLRSS